MTGKTQKKIAVHPGKPPPFSSRKEPGKGKGLLRLVARAAIGLAALVCLGVVSSGCKENVGGDTNGGSLPSADWRGWKPEQKIMEYGREDLSEYLNGAASHYLGYGFRRLWVRPYHNPANHTLTAELYDLSSGEEAYGVFSWDWSGKPLEISGAQGLYTQGALKLRKGRYYLWLVSSTPDDRYREDLVALAQQVARQLPPGLPVPPLVQKVPKEGFQADTIFYFHTKLSLDSKVSLGRKNLLLLSRKTTGVLASYRLREGQPNLLVVEYPQPEVAAKAFSSFRDGHFRKATPAEDSPALFIAETKSGVYEGMAQAGRLLALVFNGPNEEVCRRLLAAVAGH